MEWTADIFQTLSVFLVPCGGGFAESDLDGTYSAVFPSYLACPWQVTCEVIQIDGKTGLMAVGRSLLPLIWAPWVESLNGWLESNVRQMALLPLELLLVLRTFVATITLVARLTCAPTSHG